MLNPLISVLLAAAYYHYVGFHAGILVFAFVFAALTNLSITVGYHRLFSHRSFEAHPAVRFLLLLVGTSAWQ